MADTKQTKSIGEHYVCAMLARYGWAPALTRDGLARTDVLAVQTTGKRQVITVQVKTIRGVQSRASWPLGPNAQTVDAGENEWFVFVAIPHAPAEPMRCFVVPRLHVSAAVWIAHQHWLTEPGVAPGTRNTALDRARVSLAAFAGYEDRWTDMTGPATAAPVRLPAAYRQYALETRVGVPAEHPWHDVLPMWATD
ncbi:hypothetical protein [Cellulomonas iranensis]|jgi:hypothetical protein|uniref:hypothetical protein n=1 Tax=Cellulomonas iranensis TaxID=76862 RepID=UPI0013D38F78|nr:hypothetical protein [Cellulomonas iranensis]